MKAIQLKQLTNRKGICRSRSLNMFCHTIQVIEKRNTYIRNNIDFDPFKFRPIIFILRLSYWSNYGIGQDGQDMETLPYHSQNSNLKGRSIFTLQIWVCQWARTSR